MGKLLWEYLLMKNDPVSAFREFKPALRFLLVFIGVYIAGNVVYGLYVEWYRPQPDPLTKWVTSQSALLLTAFSEPVKASVSEKGPFVLLTKNDRTVLSVFEGCNGLNVMIVFASFVVAFGGKTRSIFLFILSGVVLLHLANLIRLILLYQTAVNKPAWFYYFHKYLFTAILYVVVFGLWYFWIERIRRTSKQVGPAKE